ncbi:MAG: response regulator, partial [Glaciecola sp.]|nr:response regulator [Glaciecola sp.]
NFEKMYLNLIDGHFIKPLTPSIFFEEIAAKLLHKEGQSIVKETYHSTKDLAGCEILLVEDNYINQEVVSNMLMNLHAHTTIAENGKMALDILLAHPQRFDLILMDMQMPVMDGVTTTTHIRQELELTDIPIIAMTANAMESDKQMCFDAGMNDHLSKPFDQKMLIDKIMHNLANAK